MLPISQIIEKVLRGEKIRIAVSGSGNQNDKEIAKFRIYLVQFRSLCGGVQFINCNSQISRIDGSEKLTVDIGQIPHGQREFLAGTLSEYVSKSLLTISEI